VRSCTSVRTVTPHPPCNGPSSAEAGTRTPVKKTSANSESPEIMRIGRRSMPGESIGTSRTEMPLCFAARGSVRTSSMQCVACIPCEVHTF
jgi:hypothetical protein